MSVLFFVGLGFDLKSGIVGNWIDFCSESICDGYVMIEWRK